MSRRCIRVLSSWTPQAPAHQHLMSTQRHKIARSPASRTARRVHAGFELYLQFDSLQEAPLRAPRGADLATCASRLWERLNALGISTTLVVTLRKGLNDARSADHQVRARAGPACAASRSSPSRPRRLDDYDPSRDRSRSRRSRRVIEDSVSFGRERHDPVPCHPDCLTWLRAEARRQGRASHWARQPRSARGRNTIVYERDPRSRSSRADVSGADAAVLRFEPEELLCCSAGRVPPEVGYKNVFRVLILNSSTLRLRRALGEEACVHIAHPEAASSRSTPTTCSIPRRQREDPRAPERRGGRGGAA